MKGLNLNFYGISVGVAPDSNAVTMDLLARDFSCFKSTEDNLIFDFSLEIHLMIPPWNEVPAITASMQTLNSICYDVEHFRYCDYYGELLVILDKKKNKARLYSNNLVRMHEVSYLLILSRVGKMMDLKGLHKLHAFSVSYEDIAVVCMMPMKGGKSTLLMEILKDKRFKIISDDIPLINSFGEVLPFPIKIGLSKSPDGLEIFNPVVNLYSMDRGAYGVKNLLCLDGLPGRIEKPGKIYKKIILIEAFRFNSSESILEKSGLISTFSGLMKHGVIGFGLPMVIEYFWENGPVDFLVKTKIFLKRLFGFTCFLFKARRMKLYLGKSSQKTALLITDYLEKHHASL